MRFDVIAREYGFETWPALKLHVDAAPTILRKLWTAAIKADNAPLVRAVLLVIRAEIPYQ